MERPSKVRFCNLGHIQPPGAAIEQFVARFPDQLAGCSFRQWRDAICAARAIHRTVVAAIGGHVVKCGCTPYLIAWIRRGVLTAVAMNGGMRPFTISN